MLPVLLWLASNADQLSSSCRRGHQVSPPDRPTCGELPGPPATTQLETTTNSSNFQDSSQPSKNTSLQPRPKSCLYERPDDDRPTLRCRLLKPTKAQGSSQQP
ncbi:hypothetical protein Ae201684P_022046 [Aphanomyces euteiches]|uniref:Uncharacterized protein n=1 Tax=Aphanomyces euteiches TaxID=100861 RepID=A0A6G0W7Q1_9STRA|nr:hypothetical protein Ae201684_017792 [Aphanomyces euteiches]KAH9072468.1 hypothetical protein Ae201684P_022046 [Aphanomyces euteiches]